MVPLSIICSNGQKRDPFSSSKPKGCPAVVSNPSYANIKALIITDHNWCLLTIIVTLGPFVAKYIQISQIR